MKTQEAIDHFRGVKGLAVALNIYPQTIHQWGEYPPKGRQYELQVITNCALLAEGMNLHTQKAFNAAQKGA